ncbi:unnamed protein product [Musa acuminata var. zebrina]
MPNPNAQLHHPTEGRAVESVPASTAVCHPFVEPYEFSVPKVFLRGSARSMGLTPGRPTGSRRAACEGRISCAFPLRRRCR